MNVINSYTQKNKKFLLSFDIEHGLDVEDVVAEMPH